MYLFKKLYKYIFLSIPLILPYSCGEEYSLKRQTAEGEVSIRLNIRMPSDTRQNTLSRGMTAEEESAIQTMDVYHFVDHRQNGVFEAVGAAPAAGIYLPGNPARISTTLGTYRAKHSRLVFVANARQTGNYGYRAGMKLEEFLDALVFDQLGEWNARAGSSDPLPMYGTTGNVEIHPDIPDRLLSDRGEPFLLVRMHAKFNISVSDALVGGPFELKSACVFNRATQGYLPYEINYWDDSVPSEPHATRPHIPASSGFVYEPQWPYPAAGTDASADDYKRIVNKIYLPETDNARQQDRLKKTALVIGGIFGDDSEISYYRVDIDVTNGDILRNHLYDIEIQSVAGTGEITAVEAFEGISRLSATVSPWNLAQQRTVIEGPFCLDVDCDEISFGRAGGEAIIAAMTDYDKTDRGYPAGLWVCQSDIQYSPSVSEGTGWITLADVEGADGSLSRRLKISAAPNSSPQNRSADVMLRAGNLTKSIRIGQASGPE